MDTEDRFSGLSVVFVRYHGVIIFMKFFRIFMTIVFLCVLSIIVKEIELKGERERASSRLG